MKIYYRFNRTAVLVSAALFCCCLMISLSLAADAEKTKVVTVMGSSQASADKTGSKAAAIDNSLRIAVENTALSEIPLPLLTEKFQSIANLLSDKKDEFILGYKVLQENKTDKQYRVLVSATISLDKLQQALTAAGIVTAVEKMPQVLFLIAEKYADEEDLNYWWQKERPSSPEASASAIKEILQAKGFPVVNSQIVPADFFDQLQLGAQLTDEEAVDLGKRLYADVVIVGTAVAMETLNRMGEKIKSQKSSIDLRVIFTQTGDKLGPFQAAATAADSDPMVGSQKSLADAGRQAGEKLTSQILSKWQELQKPSGEITLTVGGRNILTYLNEFRNTVKNTSGVTNQRTLEIAPDKAVLSVSYQGTSRELADAILLQTFKGFGVNIYEITNRNLNIEIVPK